MDGPRSDAELQDSADVLDREPSEQEIKEWEEQVIKIVKELEDSFREKQGNDNVGVDRTGIEVKPYRKSLPPFIAAAADGMLSVLEDMMAKESSKSRQHAWELLNCRDRHLSTAEHWAAGEGNLSCLKFLLSKRRQLQDPLDSSGCTEANKKVRRRDGKTCLHYAARNGRIETAKYLIDECGFAVDERSGDGTTPMHLACFGTHIETVQLLLDRGANPNETNDWGCGVSHWTGMAKTPNTKGSVKELCSLLQENHRVDFMLRQKQGHTALHKAAQSKNYAAIEWMANEKQQGGAGFADAQKRDLGQCDSGGHKPSDILLGVGGDKEFAQWMVDSFNW